MATPEQRAATRKRRGYWIRRARERLRWKQSALAKALGRSEGYASTISRWESGERGVPSDMFLPLALALGLPPRFLVNPPLTDEERLDRAIADAAKLEQQDWELELGDDPEDEDEPGDAPDTRSA